MASSSNSNHRSHIRSISLPCRSHHRMARIEDELNKLKTLEASSTPTAEAICNGFSGLEELYKCMDELLSLPMTQQALSLNQPERCVNESLDVSIRLLDVCGITRDFVPQIKEHVKDLQSAVRRRKGDLWVESTIAKFSCFRKKMKKDAKKVIAAVKKKDHKIGASPLLELDHHVSLVIRVLREVGVVGISVHHSLHLFLSAAISKPKSTRWSLVSKLLHKGRVACEEQQENVNELGSVDFLLNTLCRCNSIGGDKRQIAQNSLEHLEAGLESLENGLDCLFRRLLKARTSLLNIVSQESNLIVKVFFNPA